MRTRVHDLLLHSPYLDARTRWELDLSKDIIDQQLRWTTQPSRWWLTGRCPHCHRHAHIDAHPASYELPTNDGEEGVLITYLTCQRCQHGANYRVCVPLGAAVTTAARAPDE